MELWFHFMIVPDVPFNQLNHQQQVLAEEERTAARLLEEEERNAALAREMLEEE